jgi:hypothetical protein
VPRDRSAGGLVAPSHHAKQGGRGHALRPCGREPHGQVGGRTGREQLLMRSGLIQYRMEEMNPLMGVRLGHPQELSLDCLAGILVQVSQNEESFVRHRGYGTSVIRTVTAACTGLPIAAAVWHIGRQGVVEMGQQRRELLRGPPRHRP